MSLHLLPADRQLLLHCLKKGPDVQDREELGHIATQLYDIITKRSIITDSNEHMANWRREEMNGSIPSNHSFVY